MVVHTPTAQIKPSLMDKWYHHNDFLNNIDVYKKNYIAGNAVIIWTREKTGPVWALSP